FTSPSTMPLHSGLVDEYRKQFTQMDQDESGFVSREELQSLLLDMGHSEGEVREKFSQMDANQDDKVSFDEFIGLVEKLTMGRDASELEEIFKLADEEAMGFIPFETLKSILVDIIGSEERVSRGLRALRINEDEHIDCEQFIEIANSI
ncbi:hypothetical protein PMAYCL1PPCAC_12634, partial [Pristionchus mayeri]